VAARKDGAALVSESQVEAAISLLTDSSDRVVEGCRRALLAHAEMAESLLRERLSRSSGEEADALRSALVDVVGSRLEAPLIDHLVHAPSLEQGSILIGRLIDASELPGSVTAALDAMADQVVAELARPDRSGRDSDDDRELAVLTDVLVRQQQLTGADPTRADPWDAVLHGVTLRQRGLPLALCMTWLLVARRARLPLHGVNMPGHFVLRWEGSGGTRILDPHPRSLPRRPHADGRGVPAHARGLRLPVHRRDAAPRQRPRHAHAHAAEPRDDRLAAPRARAGRALRAHPRPHVRDHRRMSPRTLLLCAEDGRRRQLEDLLADSRAVVRGLPRGAPDVPWTGPAPDLLVIGAFGRTADAVEVVRVGLAAEPALSVLVVDESANWPEALLDLPGVAVVTLAARGGFAAARARLLERRALLREVASRREEPRDRLAAEALLGELPAVRELRLMLERLSDRQAVVVLAGETGTLRRRLLRHVLRTQGDLGVDSETVLVEDVDALSPVQQGSVLRLLQQGRRVVATATPRFAESVREGRFRSDLYYRLGGRPVTTVPLRERLEDLPRLARACGLVAATPEALSLLAAYDWPGNLRELELAVEHAQMLANGAPVDSRHVVLPELATHRLPSGSFVLRIPQDGVSLEAVEREAIRQTLEATDRNVAETARRLALQRGKLRYRLRRYGLGR
jgi:DNA-binding NtrC family response regulator